MLLKRRKLFCIHDALCLKSVSNILFVWLLLLGIFVMGLGCCILHLIAETHSPSGSLSIFKVLLKIEYLATCKIIWDLECVINLRFNINFYVIFCFFSFLSCVSQDIHLFILPKRQTFPTEDSIFWCTVLHL